MTQWEKDVRFNRRWREERSSRHHPEREMRKWRRIALVEAIALVVALAVLFARR